MASAKASIVGLGEAGKNIANLFRQYDEYDIHTVDSEGDPDHSIPAESGPEEYEKNYADLSLYDAVEAERIMFFLSGPGDISGASGPLLRPFYEDQKDRWETGKQIEIYYIEPDIEFLSRAEKMKERVTRNALMQMTRSAVFDRMFFFSNPRIEDILGGVPVTEYYEQINQMIFHTVHSYNYYRHSDAVFGKIREPDEICRLSTMGVIVDDEENYFYSLKLPAEKEFYFTFPKEVLENDEELIHELKETMKRKKEGEMDIALSYGLYESSYEEAQHLCVENTHVDQSLEFDEKE